MTQKELAALSGVAQAAISRIENGTKDTLRLEDVRSIAETLKFPVRFFYDQEPLFKYPLSLHGAAFRKKSSVPAKEQDAVVALANHYVLHYRRLLDAIDFEAEYKLLQFELISDKNCVSEHAEGVSSAAEAASRVRASWHLDDKPLPNLAHYIEATGVIVIEGDFGEADIDGVTLRPTGMKPIILLNQNRPSDRKRFSLAHEYGHVVLHPYPVDSMEKEANQFASELLMPKSGILPDLKYSLSIRRLGELKQKWRVAMAALIYRAKALNVIPDTAASSLYKKMNMYGYRKREPQEFDVPSDRGQVSDKLVQLHLTELGYSTEELSSALRTDPVEFASMHGLSFPNLKLKPQRPKLRIVANNNK